MITITSDIPQICLASSPIVIEGTSNCVSVEDSTLHRVWLKAQCLNGTTVVYEADLICNLNSSGLTSEFSFNLRDIATAAYRRTTSYGLDSNGLPKITRPILKMDFAIIEEYMYDGSTVQLTSSAYTLSTPITILPGAWTDGERIVNPGRYDLTNWLATAHMLSRKPSSDIAIAGRPIYIPICAAYDEDENELGTTKATITHGSQNAYSSTLSIGSATSTLANTGTYSIGVGNDSHITYTVGERRDRRELVFVNGFGQLESVVCVSNETLEQKLNLLSLFSRVKTRFGIDRSGINLASVGDRTYGLSSGPVTLEWAEWWINEVCCSEHAWLYDSHKGRWISGVVVASEKNTLYDRGKGDAPSISFSFVTDEK